MTHQQDIMVMKLEADFLTTFQAMKDTLDQYADLYMTLNFDQSNSFKLQKYHEGLQSLAAAFSAVADCFESLCGCKNISLH